MNSARRKLISVMTAFLLSLSILSSICTILIMNDYHRERDRHHYIAINQVENIITTVDCVMARVYTLNAMVQDNDGETAFFDKMTKELFNAVKEETGVTLKNIALAPEGVVEKVYPYIGNESLVGFNFMDPSKPGNREAIEAYKNGKTILTNPFDLVQGGKGIAGRAPVIMDLGETELLWGLVTVTMDYDNLMDVLKLDNLKKMGMSYKLSFIDDNGERTTMKEAGTMGKNPVTIQFSVRNLQWEFSLMPEAYWSQISKIIISGLVVLLISSLVALYTKNMINLQISNEKLKNLSFTDGLTGAYSRNYVNSVLINLKDGNWRDPMAEYSLMIIDIDNFKQVNDTYGHEVGDKVVVTVSDVIKNTTNETSGDRVIRFGGDEFIVLLNKTDRKKMIQLGTKILSNLKQVCKKDLHGMNITISGGVALNEECADKKYNSMLVAADKKLYAAKEKGKNRIEI